MKIKKIKEITANNYKIKTRKYNFLVDLSGDFSVYKMYNKKGNFIYEFLNYELLTIKQITAKIKNINI